MRSLLAVSGVLTVALGIAHFFFPKLFDFDHAIPREGAPLRPFRLGPLRYQTQRSDVRGIAWVMNAAASYVLVSLGALDLWASRHGWPAGSAGHLLSQWVAGWWFLRAGTQFYLGHRRGDWLIVTGFALLYVEHVLVGW